MAILLFRISWEMIDLHLYSEIQLLPPWNLLGRYLTFYTILFCFHTSHGAALAYPYIPLHEMCSAVSLQALSKYGIEWNQTEILIPTKIKCLGVFRYFLPLKGNKGQCDGKREVLTLRVLFSSHQFNFLESSFNYRTEFLQHQGSGLH